MTLLVRDELTLFRNPGKTNIASKTGLDSRKWKMNAPNPLLVALVFYSLLFK